MNAQKFIMIAAVCITLVSCIHVQPAEQNIMVMPSVSNFELTGNVKSVRLRTYSATMKFGELVKSDNFVIFDDPDDDCYINDDSYIDRYNRKYEFDEKGKLTAVTIYYSDFDSNDSQDRCNTIKSKYIYKYNDNDFIDCVDLYNSDGDLEYHYTLEYDNSHLIKIIQFNDKSETEELWEYEYDESFNVVKYINTEYKKPGPDFTVIQDEDTWHWVETVDSVGRAEKWVRRYGYNENNECIKYVGYTFINQYADAYINGKWNVPEYAEYNGTAEDYIKIYGNKWWYQYNSITNEYEECEGSRDKPSNLSRESELFIFGDSYFSDCTSEIFHSFNLITSSYFYRSHKVNPITFNEFNDWIIGSIESSEDKYIVEREIEYY